jgi:hypothetical protein
MSVIATACGSTKTRSVSTTAASTTSVPASTTTEPPTTTTTTTSPTAATQLNAFFAQAHAVDVRLRAAARAINGGIGQTVVTFDQRIVDAVRAADPKLATNAIPAGMNEPLLRSVLLVASDLFSRRAAYNRVWVRTFARDGDEAKDLMTCLGGGAVAAARFDADLAAARALAQHTTPFTLAAPASRAAEEVAVRVQDIFLANAGCDSCGGARLTEWPTITWGRFNPGGGMRMADGKIRDIGFSATYASGKGWTIMLFAC